MLGKIQIKRMNTSGKSPDLVPVQEPVYRSCFRSGKISFSLTFHILMRFVLIFGGNNNSNSNNANDNINKRLFKKSNFSVTCKLWAVDRQSNCSRKIVMFRRVKIVPVLEKNRRTIMTAIGSIIIQVT